MAKLIYPELSYKLMGVLFKVHRDLGNSYQEKYYQRAIAIALKEASIAFEKEFRINLSYSDKKIGHYSLDFVIEDKIALEIKTVPKFTATYQKQVLAYLNSAKLKLGIIANFRTERLTYKRLINPLVKIGKD